MVLLGNQMVKMQDGSMVKLQDLGNYGGSRYVPITDLVLGEDYIIDDTNISAFVVSQIVTHAESPGTTFIMPATYIDTSKITVERQLFCQFTFNDVASAALFMSVGCSFKRRTDGKVAIYINNIGIDDVSIGYFLK